MTRRLAYLPVLLVTVGLFGAGLLLAGVQSLGGLPVTGKADWGVAAYRELFSSRSFWSALGMSAWVAGAGTLIAAALGTLAALALWRLRAGAGLRFLFAWNLPVPHVVAAWVTLLLFSQSGLWSRLAHVPGLSRNPGDFPALVNDPLALGVLLELAWKEVPFVGLAVLAALARFDGRLLEVARSLGASRWTRFWHVVLPGCARRSSPRACWCSPSPSHPSRCRTCWDPLPRPRCPSSRTGPLPTRTSPPGRRRWRSAWSLRGWRAWWWRPGRS